MNHLEISARAKRDLRKLQGPDRRHIVGALDALAGGAANLDVTPLNGHPPWWRMRQGDWRVLYRALTSDEQAARGVEGKGWLVARVVNRRDLERAVETL